MIKIKDIKKLNLNITWRLLYRGVLKKQLEVGDIVKYAMEQLENGNDRIEICELAGFSCNDFEGLINILSKLTEEEGSKDDFEDRKLRAVIINNFLKNKSDNCIDGLIGLTDLWIGLGFPSDSPHIIQGMDNNISPMDYYTDDNYNYLYEKNMDWLKHEIDFLISQQR